MEALIAIALMIVVGAFFYWLERRGRVEAECDLAVTKDDHEEVQRDAEILRRQRDLANMPVSDLKRMYKNRADTD